MRSTENKLQEKLHEKVCRESIYFLVYLISLMNIPNRTFWNLFESRIGAIDSEMMK